MMKNLFAAPTIAVALFTATAAEAVCVSTFNGGLTTQTYSAGCTAFGWPSDELQNGAGWGPYLINSRSLISANGLYAAVAQMDGNFVVYYTGGQDSFNALGCDPSGACSAPVWNPLWATGTSVDANHTMYAVLQTWIDGNFVVYSHDINSGHDADPTLDTPMWAAMTNGKGAVRVTMQNDGNLVAYSSPYGDNSEPLWASGTAGRTH